MDATDDTAGGRSTGRGARRRVHVVPHTHWDREWYASFQTFRLRLVDLLDDLLPRMDADPSYARFLLDGQLAVVDDYLAVRPAAEDRLRRLVGSGRIAVGPWYTLPDEFLVGGETLVRNLQLGMRVGDRFGGAMAVGYLPDMFGHVGQMPQILAGFGFEHAVVWRGVPAAVARTGFWWQSPDGTAVRAEYLPQGYGNGSALPDDAKAFVAAVTGFADLWRDVVVGPVLWMNGTDHQMPQPWLGRVVAEANDLQDDLDLRIVSLAEHLDAAPTGGLPTWRGELRSGARANLLMGVVSNRVDVRQASARAERALLQGAEPLSALFLPPARWPGALLEVAWRGVILNSAHDSVCACSIDEVCDAVLHRYAEAADIGVGLADRAAAALAARVDHDGPVVVNPTARRRGGIVELTLAGSEAPAGTQLVRARAAEAVLHQGPPAIVLPAVEELDWLPGITAFWLEAEDGTVLLSGRREGAAQMVTAEVRAALAGLHDTGHLRIRVRQPAEVTVLAPVAEVPGFGWRGWRPEAAPATTPVTVSDGGPGPVLANGRVTVAIDPTDGTFSLDGHGGLGRLVDGGDCGDTYNWCPPAADTLVDTPDGVEVRVLERGPVRARVLIVARYRWPARRQGLDRRTGEVPHEVRTLVELRAGDRAARVEVAVDNRSRDHRLRAHFPLPSPATGSRAECAFGPVERGLEAEGGRTEAPLATWPAQRFVQAGGLTVVHDGVAEYELVGLTGGAAHELALTLLRATGMLSQVPMPTRPLPAGPLVPAEGAQLQRRLTLRYAVAVGDDVDPYALADEVLVPLRTAGGDGASRGATAVPGREAGRDLPAVGSGLTVTGAEVAAVVREGDGVVVRVFNPTDAPAEVRVAGRRGWCVDLRGRPLAPFEETVELLPFGIATLALAEG
ncbi:MAG TPA: glycoside hydrolase family 38 C-terminal domain-containing protein [Acidimicrobiales bacterium]|nr:glycoside hydrolase family 38 C-terminal domain-containing protein [Acidimicrobiales bacterium]